MAINYYPLLSDSYNPYLIAAGKIAGKFDYRRLGRNTGINNVLTDVASFLAAGSLYVPPPSPIQMRLVSSSANDTAAGTGVRTVELNYLDTNYAEQTELVTLNGVTPVNTVATNILRVNELHTKTVGSGGVAAGNIQCQNTAGTVVYRQVDAGFNIDFTAFYTVPMGKNYSVTAWNISEGTGTGAHYTQFFLRTTSTHNGVLNSGVFYVHDIASCQNASLDMEFNVPIVLPPTTDIKISAISDAGGAGAQCTAHFSGWIESA